MFLQIGVCEIRSLGTSDSSRAVCPQGEWRDGGALRSLATLSCALIEAAKVKAGQGAEGMGLVSAFPLRDWWPCI